jgi:hypothetical protein
MLAPALAPVPFWNDPHSSSLGVEWLSYVSLSARKISDALRYSVLLKTECDQRDISRLIYVVLGPSGHSTIASATHD